MALLQTITSRDNAKLKQARRIRDGKELGSMFIEGVRLAEEVLRSDIEIENAFISESAASTGRGREFVDRLQTVQSEMFLLSDRLADSIADTTNSQGVILIAKRPAADRKAFETRILESDDRLSLLVLLDRINDPANLGAVLRTAEAAGAAVIISSGSADVFSPKSLRASMGAAFRVIIWEKANADEVVLWAASKDFVTTAAEGNGLVNYDEIDWNLPRLLVIGSEANGLDPNVKEKMDDIVRIPMANNVESLNLAVAAGIIMFEAFRQRRSEGLKSIAK